MLKWTLRIGGAFLGLIVLAIVGVFAAYSLWISDRNRELTAGSRIASTSLGEVEYAILGEGAPRLLIHGTPGGYDQALIDPRVRAEAYADVQAIGVSRPGYLRTPLSSGETPGEQADLYAALLDELGIQSAVVLAVSGGAPSALQLAIRHPERVDALILLVPLLRGQNYPPEIVTRSSASLMIQDFAIFLRGESQAGRALSGFDPDDPSQVAQARAFLRSVVPAGKRAVGVQNDLEHFSGLDTSYWPLEDVMVPTLLLHGNADANAPYEGSVMAATRIPNAELVTFEGGDHSIVVTRSSEIDEHISRFLAELDEEASSSRRRNSR